MSGNLLVYPRNSSNNLKIPVGVGGAAAKNGEQTLNNNSGRDDDDVLELEKLLQEIDCLDDVLVSPGPLKQTTTSKLVDSRAATPSYFKTNSPPGLKGVALPSKTASSTSVPLPGPGKLDDMVKSSLHSPLLVNGVINLGSKFQSRPGSETHLDLSSLAVKSKTTMGAVIEPMPVAKPGTPPARPPGLSLADLAKQFKVQSKSNTQPSASVSVLTNCAGTETGHSQRSVLPGQISANRLGFQDAQLPQLNGADPVSTTSLTDIRTIHSHSIIGPSLSDLRICYDQATPGSAAYSLTNIPTHSGQSEMDGVSFRTSASFSQLNGFHPQSNLSLVSCLKVKDSGLKGKQSWTGEEKTVNLPLTNKNDEIEIDQDDCLMFWDDTKVDPGDLLAPGSCLGHILTSQKLKRKMSAVDNTSRPAYKFSRFTRTAQVGRRKLYVTETKLHKIRPFEFLTPSPDDIIRSKQKEAFTRPDTEFEF